MSVHQQTTKQATLPQVVADARKLCRFLGLFHLVIGIGVFGFAWFQGGQIGSLLALLGTLWLLYTGVTVAIGLVWVSFKERPLPASETQIGSSKDSPEIV